MRAIKKPALIYEEFNAIFCIIGKLDIFLLMCTTDKAGITELTLIHKNIRSVRYSHAQVYRSI